MEKLNIKNSDIYYKIFFVFLNLLMCSFASLFIFLPVLGWAVIDTEPDFLFVQGYYALLFILIFVELSIKIFPLSPEKEINKKIDIAVSRFNVLLFLFLEIMFFINIFLSYFLQEYTTFADIYYEIIGKNIVDPIFLLLLFPFIRIIIFPVFYVFCKEKNIRFEFLEKLKDFKFAIPVIIVTLLFEILPFVFGSFIYKFVFALGGTSLSYLSLFIWLQFRKNIN